MAKAKTLRFISPLHRANRQIGIYMADRFVERECTPAEGHLLTYVNLYGPCPIAELCRVFGYKPTTLTSMLDRLVEKGFVVRDVNPEDRRSFLVSVTPAGGDLAVEARGEVERIDAAIRRRISASDLAGFERVMAAVAEVTGITVRPKKE